MVEPQTQDKWYHTSYSQVKKDCCTIFNILHKHSFLEGYFGVLAGFQMAKERADSEKREKTQRSDFRDDLRF